ncbi:MAG: phosphodiester glycosidase family protein, partial [Armatimonadota bacterium]
LHITGGELVSEPMSDRMVIGITADGRCLFDTLGFDGRLTLKDGRWIDIKGINRPRGKNEIVAYTPKFSPSTTTTEPGAEVVVKLDGPVRVGKSISGVVSEISSHASNTVIPEDSIVLSGSGPSSNPLVNWLQPGDQICIGFRLTSKRSGKWDDVIEAVGGGPCLIRNGAIHLGYDEEGFGPAFATTLHPRTAIGITKTGKILLATIDGRQTISRGIGLKQLAELLLSKGCIEAANLDGGGSSTLATAFGVLNSPSEGIERPVANAIAVMGKTRIYDEPQPHLIITPAYTPVQSGSSMQFSLTNADGSTVDQVTLDNIIWSATGGAGFVDQNGKFYGVKSRKGNIIATLGSVPITTPVEVVPGTPVKFGAKLDPDPGGAPNRGSFTVSATDANLNTIDGQVAAIKVSGGTADSEILVTSRKSKAQTGITWDDSTGVKAYVEVSMQGLKTQILSRYDK